MAKVIYGKNPKGETISGSTTVIGSNCGWKTRPLMIWDERICIQAGGELISEWFPTVPQWKTDFMNEITPKIEQIKKTPMTAGTCLHYMIECDLKGIKPDLSQYTKEVIDLAETGFLNYLEWKDNVKFRVHKTEISLTHKELWYGSTLDCVAWINDKLSLFDWKLASGIYEDYLIQIESYRQNWNFNNPSDPLLGMHLLKIDKERPNYTHHYWDQCPEAWEAFQHLLKLHNLHKILKKQIA